MQINESGLDIIKYWEKNPETGTFYDKAYLDSERVPTIGWGTIRWDMKTPVKLGETITEEEANNQLRIELIRIQDAIDTSIHVPLNSNQYSALCSLFYNIGTGWCTGKGHQQATFVKRLNAGNYDYVPTGMLQFVRGAKTGKKYNGLRNRRQQEVKLWLTPDEVNESDDNTVEEVMPQVVIPEKGSMTQAAKESWTVRGAGMALVASVVQGWDWLFSTANQAGTQIAEIQKATGPFHAMLIALKANAGGIAIGIGILGITIAIIRRLQAARDGKIG